MSLLRVNTVRLLILSLGLFVCAIAGALLSMGAASGLGWLDVQSAGAPAALGGLSLLVGTLVSLPIVAAGLQGGVDRLSACVVASGVVRGLLGVSAATAAFFLIKPDGRVLFSSFLCAALLALVIETAWALFILKRSPASEPGTRVGGSA